MGFMTEVSILNDAWHHIQANPEEFVRAIQRGMGGHPGESHGIGNHANPIVTYPSHHADDARVYIAYRNSFQTVDEWVVGNEHGERLRAELAEGDTHLYDVLFMWASIAEERARAMKEYLKQMKEEATQ